MTDDRKPPFQTTGPENVVMPYNMTGFDPSTYNPLSLNAEVYRDDCGMDTCPWEPPCDFHGDGEPEDHDDE